MKRYAATRYLPNITLPAIPLLFAASGSAQLNLDLTVEAIYWPGYSGGVRYRATVSLGGPIPPAFSTVGNLLSQDSVWAVALGSSQTQNYVSLADLKSGLAASSEWSLTLNASLPGEYTASIPMNVSALLDEDFPSMSITTPLDGAVGVSPNTPIVWTAPSGYSGGPGYIVDANGTPLVVEYSGSVGAGVTSWTPPAPLTAGSWSALVSYTKPAPLGTGFQISVADADLMTANTYLMDSASSGFSVVPEPSTWAMVAGVGLVAFGIVRRVRANRGNRA